MSKYVYPQQESAVHSLPVLSDVPPSRSLVGRIEEESGAASRWGQSVWQCLSGARGPVSVCQGKFIVEAGGPTHIHPHLGHRLVCPCLCLYAGWQPSQQLRTESVGAENHYGNQHSGPGCGCSWISAETFFWHPLSAGVDYRVPSLKMSFPGKADDLMCAVFFFYLSWKIDKYSE